MNALDKLRDVAREIREAKDPMKLAEQWALAGRLLARFNADPKAVADVVSRRDRPALDTLIFNTSAALNPAANAPPAPKPAEFPQDLLDRAMHACRKRLKVMRLADESKLGGRYTSGGRASNIDAIQPPDGFEPAVWDALARAGRLTHTGQGFYADVPNR